MNKTDIAKIKRRLSPDGRNPIEIRGWYVNGKKAVISEVSRSIMSLTQTESEKYTQIFKRVLSGDIGKNLTMVKFPLSEVMGGEVHERLMQLTHTAFSDEELYKTFLQILLDNTQMEGNNLILLMHDTYDLDFHATNDEGEINDAAPSNVFKYIICAVCPVKLGKSILTYDSFDNDFVTKDPDWVVTAPDMGFMFPCFEDGGANISQALFYTKDMGIDHSDFLSAILSSEEVKPVLESKEALKSVLMDSLEEECSYDVIQSVNGQLIEKLEEQKKDKQSEPVRLSGKDIADVLTRSGVSDDKVCAFEEKFEEEFGAGADLPLAGITDDKQLELKTQDITVKLNPKQAGLIETRVIDGMKYILIPADEVVTVNGISIDI